MSKLHFRSVAWSLFTMKMQTVLQSSSWIVFPDWTLILLISLPWLIDLTYLSQISWSSKYILMFLTSNEDTHFFNTLWLKETRHSCSNDLTDLQCASWDFVMPLDLVLQSKVQFASEHHVERWNATIFKTQQIEIQEITCNLYYIWRMR